MNSRLVIIFTFLATLVFGQKQDSLLQALRTETDPDKKAEIYLKLVTYYSESDSAKARSFLNKAIELTSENNIVGKAEIENSLGFYYMSKDPEKGKKHHLRGIKLLEGEQSAEVQNLRAKLWFNVAADEQRLGNIKEAMNTLLNRGIPEAKKAQNKIYLANNYLTVGLIFYNDNNLDKALQYHQLAVQQLNAMPATAETNKFLTVANLYIAEVYLKKEDYRMADSYLDISEKLLIKYPNDDIQPELYHLRSIYYLNTGQYEKALETVNEGLLVVRKVDNMYQTVRLTFMKSKVLSNLGKFDDAAKTLKELLNNKIYVSNYGRNISTIYDELWMLEERKGDYKAALSYAKQRMMISDSLSNNDQNKAINEMETKFRTAEKEKQLAVKELEINRKNQYMWASIFAALVFLGAGIFTFLFFRNKKKLSEQREINLQQQLKEKEQIEELNVTKAILDGEERERERVAKDLHDGLGGMLAGVKINLSTWSNNNLEEDQYESFHRILNQLDSSVSELRRVARNLMPESLLNFGLEIALKDLCEFYMKDDLQIDFQAINIEKNLPLNLQVNIYRIVQELLNNAVKHSEANNILVQCSQNGSEFYITVEDNGKGIQETEMNKLKSLGLKNLKNRINFLKGKMEIQSAKDQGTSINIELNTNVA